MKIPRTDHVLSYLRELILIYFHLPNANVRRTVYILRKKIDLNFARLLRLFQSFLLKKVFVNLKSDMRTFFLSV